MSEGLFSPLAIRDLTLRNRVAVSPMCMYSCEACDGVAGDWHLVHLGSRASGGAGLVVFEATAVEPEGRISPQDLGIWSDDHVAGLKRVTDFVRSQGAASAIQLAHAGRKAGTYRPWSEARGWIAAADGGWVPKGPSSLAFKDGAPIPHELSRGEILDVIELFVDGAERALAAGFDVVELHSAHGYLLHSFLSPLSNVRSDEYGGSFEGRTRMLVETVEAVRSVWPEGRPLFVRLSCTDWVDGGWTIDDSVQLAKILGALGVDLVDCSSGGSVASAEIPVRPGYQVEFAERIRREAGVMTGAVGLITEAGQGDEIVKKSRADLVLLGREMLRDAYWANHAAVELEVKPKWPDQYDWPLG